MARYILIDYQSCFIVGDTLNLPLDKQKKIDFDPILAARWIDESLGIKGRRYDLYLQPPQSKSTDGVPIEGYAVYRADIDGLGVIPIGEHQALIDKVTSYCDYMGFVTFEEPPNEAAQ